MSEFQKYPEDKQKFDENYLRIFGETCSHCGGTGGGGAAGWIRVCPRCRGLGYIEKRKKK